METSVNLIRSQTLHYIRERDLRPHVSTIAVNRLARNTVARSTVEGSEVRVQARRWVSTAGQRYVRRNK